MRVLHLINSLVIGGAETLVIETVNELEKREICENYLVTLYGEGPMLDRLNNKIPYHCLYLNTWNLFSTIKKLRNYIKSNLIDVVHSHLYDATILARLSAPQRVSLISSYHTGFHNHQSIEFSVKRLWVDKLTYRKRYHTVFVSGSVKEDICKPMKMTGNYTVLKNFISEQFVKQYEFNDRPQLKLIAVGNLRAQKNHHLAIQALEKLREYPISLDIYGKGTLKNDLIAYAESLKVKVKIFTDIEINSMLLAQYDAFLMTSKHEGMPLALIEAMTTGLPSILNDIPPLKETAVDAALYFEKDSAEDLSEVLLHCLQNKKILRTLSSRASEIANGYTLKDYINNLSLLYHKVITKE